MKADLRISIKDYARNKNLKILLFRPPFPSRGFMVKMNGRGLAEQTPTCGFDGLGGGAEEGGASGERRVKPVRS